MRLLWAIAGCFLALFAGALAALVAEWPAQSSFKIAQTMDEDAIWRLNQKTGQVSVCGVSLTGHALSEMESRLSSHIRAAGHDPKRLAALLPEIDQLDDLARPRCSPWSADEAHTEIAMDAPQ